MASNEAIHVFVRIRPPISDDINYNAAVFADSESSITLTDKKHNVSCSYEHVFPDTTGQEEVFESILPLLDDVLNGFNGCIFAYGQTSAGKTHTMLGKNGGVSLLDNELEWGILPRAADYMFAELEEKEKQGLCTFCVKASFLQIYNECIYDLLNSNYAAPTINHNNSNEVAGRCDEDDNRKDAGLKIREVAPSRNSGKQKKGKKGSNSGLVGGNSLEVYVSGLSEFRVHTAHDVLQLLTIGANNRATRATAFNESSSRSHAILTLNFEIETGGGKTGGGKGQRGSTIYRSKLNMVDLAGSEKMYNYVSAVGSEHHSSTQHVRELTTINKSLHALGNVIAALSTPANTHSGSSTHVPFRDSKLTRLLQDSLGGNTRTILMACVAPTCLHSQETLSTLSFADRAKNVMCKVPIKANVVVDDKGVLLSRAETEIVRLKSLLKKTMKRCEALENRLGGGGGGLDSAGDVDLDRTGGIAGMEAEDDGYGQINQDVVIENMRLKQENDELREQLRGLAGGKRGNANKKPSLRQQQLNHQEQLQLQKNGLYGGVDQAGSPTLPHVNGNSSNTKSQPQLSSQFLTNAPPSFPQLSQTHGQQGGHSNGNNYNGGHSSAPNPYLKHKENRQQQQQQPGQYGNIKPLQLQQLTRSPPSPISPTKERALGVGHEFDSPQRFLQQQNVSYETAFSKKGKQGKHAHPQVDEEEEEDRHGGEEEDAQMVNKLREKLNKARTQEQRNSLDKQLTKASSKTNQSLAQQEAELQRIHDMKMSLEAELHRATQGGGAEEEDVDDEYGNDDDFEESVDEGGGSVGKSNIKKLQSPTLIEKQQEEESRELEKKLDTVLAKQFGASSGSGNRVHMNALSASGTTSPVVEAVVARTTGKIDSGGTTYINKPKMVGGGSGSGTEKESGENEDPNAKNSAPKLSYSKEDITTKILMFSFRLNTWEVVTIVDFEPSRGLHKLDNSNKWIDLKKKPIRKYQGDEGV